MNQALRLPCHVTTHTLKLVLLPLLTALAPTHSVSGVASKGIGLPHVHQSNLVDLSALSLSLGKITSSKPLMAPTSVSITMSGTLVQCSPQVAMACTPAPYVATCSMVPTFAPETSLKSILYTHTTPYVPSTWLDTLFTSNLLTSFPNLVHEITYPSPIGSPPTLSKCFLTSQPIFCEHPPTYN